MTTHYEEDDTNLDKILLIARRIFLVLFVLFILRIVLFKIIGIGKDKGIIFKGDTKSMSGDIQKDTANGKTTQTIKLAKSMTDLGQNYQRTGNSIYYKGKKIDNVNADNFVVINEKGEYTVNGTVVNSTNLLNIFKDSKRRWGLMHEIDDITKNEVNLTDKLKGASENGMYKIRNDLNDLSRFDRDDRYNMTDEQRAKFAIMFLYVKIIKAYSNDKIQMKLALNELKYFIENFDANTLKEEKNDKDLKEIKGDIAMDEHCIYVDGKLYACLLDKIFLK